MKFEDVQEISDIVFEDDPNATNCQDQNCSPSKMKLDRKFVTQQHTSGSEKKVYLPSMRSFLRHSQSDHLGGSMGMEIEGFDSTLPKPIGKGHRLSVRMIRWFPRER